jgi:glycosyltransferase involved in cell wall biosynthesis
MTDSLGVAGMRIAHLIESDGPGGAERFLAHMASALQAAGASNVAILPAGGEGWLEHELRGSGVAIEHFRLERPLSPACARGLAATLRRHQIDVAHSHEFTMAVYGGWASWRVGIPQVVTMHGSLYYAERLRRRVALRAALAVRGRTVAVSESLARRLGRDLWMPASRIAMIANGVPCSTVSSPALRAELGLGSDDRLLVSVGNLYPVKGHRILLEALSLLGDRHRAVHVAIAGRGALEGELMAAARDYGLAPRVHLIGLRSDVPAVLAAADVFVLPSLSEGLPLALLEAMFAGRPIVASAVGEVADALAHGAAGVLVPAGDPRALATAVDGVLSDPERARALGHAAARRAAAEYDISRMVRRYVDLYEEALGRRPAAPRNAAAVEPA